MHSILKIPPQCPILPDSNLDPNWESQRFILNFANKKMDASESSSLSSISF